MYTKGQLLIRVTPFEGSDLKVGDIVAFKGVNYRSRTHMYVDVIKSKTDSGLSCCIASHFRPLPVFKRKSI